MSNDNQLEKLVFEAETVSSLMKQIADDDVGSKQFSVMSDLGENGTEHECDLDVGETVLRAAAAIDKLLAELESAQQRVAELENDEVRQRLANAEHQLHTAELAKHNLKASRRAQFRKRIVAERRIAELAPPAQQHYLAGYDEGHSRGLCAGRLYKEDSGMIMHRHACANAYVQGLNNSEQD